MNEPDEARPPAERWAWDADEDPAPGPRRRWLLVAAAALPWLVVAVLVLRGGQPTHDTAVLAPAAPIGHTDAPAPAPEPALAPSPSVAGDPPGSAAAVTVSSAARHGVDVGDAITTAIVAARSSFTGPGPRGPAAPEGTAVELPGYLEHVWVEAVDAPWRGHVVVTLGVVVLTPDADDELVPVARRLAVPVRLDADGAAVAGTAYLLPDPRIDSDPIQLEPITDADQLLAATDALVDAGYAVDEVLELGRSEGWPWVVTFRGASPHDPEATTQRVWLRPHLGAFVVAGWLPAPPTPPTPPDDHEESAP